MVAASHDGILCHDILPLAAGLEHVDVWSFGCIGLECQAISSEDKRMCTQHLHVPTPWRARAEDLGL